MEVNAVGMSAGGDGSKPRERGGGDGGGPVTQIEGKSSSERVRVGSLISPSRVSASPILLPDVLLTRLSLSLLSPSVVRPAHLLTSDNLSITAKPSREKEREGEREREREREEDERKMGLSDAIPRSSRYHISNQRLSIELREKPFFSVEIIPIARRYRRRQKTILKV